MSTPPGGPPPPNKGGLILLGIAIGAVATLMLVILFLGLAWLGFSYFHGRAAPPQVVTLNAPPVPRPPGQPPMVRVQPVERFDRMDRIERVERVDRVGPVENVVVTEPLAPPEPPGAIAPVFHLRSPGGNLLAGKAFTLETAGEVRTTAAGYLVVSDSKELRIPGPMSISVWFNARTVDRPMTLCSRALNGPPWQFPFSSWLLRINDPIHLEGTLTGAGGYSPSTWISQPIKPGQWHHIVFTYDGRKKKLYLNGGQAMKLLSGKLDHTNPNRYAPGRSVLIGADESDSPVAEIFDGAIDDLRIFNRALPEEEILELYAKPPPSAEGGGNRLRE